MGQGERGSSDDNKKDKRPIFQKKEERPGTAESPPCCGCRFPLLVAALQLLLGLSTAVVAFLTLAACSSLSARETPHWAGIIVSSSSPSTHRHTLCDLCVCVCVCVCLCLLVFVCVNVYA